jgi:uncharacterized iron-regulated membrane protein
MLRPALVIFHRFVGLALVGFLVFAGLTGAVLAWYKDLDGLFFPALLQGTSPAPGAVPLDSLVLREKVAEAFPDAFVSWAQLTPEPGRSLAFDLAARPGAPAPEHDQAFADPYTGEVLGARKWGEISQGSRNLMPFLYRLHYSLALGETGELIFGIVALIWALDCFVGACLTFPPVRKSFWRQWAKAWMLRMNGSAYKLNFDLHRAGGLWVWAMLLTLAWSAVSFNLRPVYEPVMKTLFSYQEAAAIDALPEPLLTPPLDWHAALEQARVLMAEEARARGFIINDERWLGYVSDSGVYRYHVHSSHDVADDWGMTRVVFSGSDGRLLEFWSPGVTAGDRIDTWLLGLHMAALWGRPFDLFMTGLGLMVAILSVTGFIIWRKKHKARRWRKLVARSPANENCNTSRN